MAAATRALAAAAAAVCGGGRRGLVSAARLATAQPEDLVDGEAVEAALNTKNVEVLQDVEKEVAGGVVLEGADASTAWVPDEETGVFGPADTATHVGGSSSLEQTVFVREDDMEDVERPPMADAE